MSCNPSATKLPPKFLSVVIPARNEEGSIAETLCTLHSTLAAEGIVYELIVVDDGSRDSTPEILARLQESIRELRVIQGGPANGFGRAVTRGLDHARGDAIIIMMADLSDSPEDVITYWKKLCEGWECVFGTRFSRGGKAIDYPWFKLILNRVANRLLALFFNARFNDITNAFKAYRKEVIEGVRPLLSPHFNLTVELPLKAMVRGYSWTVVPITWRNRKAGQSAFKIREMGSRYFFICAYVWLEKYFSRGDYLRKQVTAADSALTPNPTPQNERK